MRSIAWSGNLPAVLFSVSGGSRIEAFVSSFMVPSTHNGSTHRCCIAIARSQRPLCLMDLRFLYENGHGGKSLAVRVCPVRTLMNASVGCARKLAMPACVRFGFSPARRSCPRSSGRLTRPDRPVRLGTTGCSECSRIGLGFVVNAEVLSEVETSCWEVPQVITPRCNPFPSQKAKVHFQQLSQLPLTGRGRMS